MSTRPTMPNHVEVGDDDTSDLWRAVQVFQKGVVGWILRSDHFPFGTTLRPNTRPADLKASIARDLRVRPDTIALMWNPR